MNTSRHASNPSGSSAPNLSIEELIDAQPLSVRQLAIVALCFAVAALDGLDLAIVGFVAPAILAEWQLHANDLALLFSAGLLGLTIGAFATGPIADTGVVVQPGPRPSGRLRPDRVARFGRLSRDRDSRPHSFCNRFSSASTV